MPPSRAWAGRTGADRPADLPDDRAGGGPEARVARRSRVRDDGRDAGAARAQGSNWALRRRGRCRADGASGGRTVHPGTHAGSKARPRSRSRRSPSGRANNPSSARISMSYSRSGRCVPMGTVRCQEVKLRIDERNHHPHALARTQLQPLRHVLRRRHRGASTPASIARKAAALRRKSATRSRPGTPEGTQRRLKLPSQRHAPPVSSADNAAALTRSPPRRARSRAPPLRSTTREGPRAGCARPSAWRAPSRRSPPRRSATRRRGEPPR